MGRLAKELREAGPSPALSEIEQQLKALGAVDYPGRGSAEVVFSALVKCWKGRKDRRPPTGREVGESVGLPERRALKLLDTLVKSGRVIRSPEYGWVPKVVKP